MTQHFICKDTQKKGNVRNCVTSECDGLSDIVLDGEIVFNLSFDLSVL